MKSRTTYRKSIPAMVLLCIYLLNPLKLCMPYMDYKVNYNYIVNFLCENKDKPELNCSGKCYLSKSVKDNQEKDGDHQRINSKNYLADEIPLEAISLKREYKNPEIGFTFFTQSYISSFPEISSPPPKSIS